MLYDAVIIGGGVSGLAAAYQLTHKNMRVMVVDRGKHIYERHRYNSFDVANGIGGAGLFSDGKVSFYPSASKLWKLSSEDIERAYKQFQTFLSDFDITIDDFSANWPLQQNSEDGMKNYPSKILSAVQRMNIVFKLCETIGRDHLLTETEVTRISKVKGNYHLFISSKNGKKELIAKSIVIAGGKHSYYKLSPKMTGITLTKKQYLVEIGVRIECPNSDFDYYDYDQPDVKLIETHDSQTSIRTFCCCRDGVVLESVSYGMMSLNGSSNDLEKTGFSNIGILVRFEGKNNIALGSKIVKNLEQTEKSLKISLRSFMKGASTLLGEETDSLIREFLNSHFPRMSASDATLYHPSIEKAGYFSELTKTLQMPNENIWVVGDASGMFRGIMPSFVSGFLVSDCISAIIEAFEHDLQKRFHIKVSDSKKKKVVFTAQSKQYFYCRDAVCEYVLRQNCIPINPFRIFDYFLGDRVDRNLIRNGNNEMISRCDELWVFGLISDGVLFEIYLCRKLGIPVRFFNIETRASEIYELKEDEVKFEPEIHARQIKKDDLQTLAGNNSEMPKALQMELQWDE